MNASNADLPPFAEEKPYKKYKGSRFKDIELNDKHINDITIEAFIEKSLHNPKLIISS
jgi:hypothetical protein